MLALGQNWNGRDNQELLVESGVGGYGSTDPTEREVVFVCGF